MNFSNQDILAFLSLQVAILIAVIAGIVRSESRMTKTETLLSELAKQLGNEIAGLKEHINDHEKRIRDLERQSK